jgi:hypothetical protein
VRGYIGDEGYDECPEAVSGGLFTCADTESYELKDEEETPVVSEDERVYPIGKTFV